MLAVFTRSLVMFHWCLLNRPSLGSNDLEDLVQKLDFALTCERLFAAVPCILKIITAMFQLQTDVSKCWRRNRNDRNRLLFCRLRWIDFQSFFPVWPLLFGLHQVPWGRCQQHIPRNGIISYAKVLFLQSINFWMFCHHPYRHACISICLLILGKLSLSYWVDLKAWSNLWRWLRRKILIWWKIWNNLVTIIWQTPLKQLNHLAKPKKNFMKINFYTIEVSIKFHPFSFLNMFFIPSLPFVVWIMY